MIKAGFYQYRYFFALCFVSLFLFSCSGGNDAVNQASQTFRYAVDPGLFASESDTRDGRPTGVVEDSSGTQSRFVLNEAIITPASNDELTSFLYKYSAVVIADNAVPAPPPQLQVSMDPSYLVATQYTVRFDPSSFPMDTFMADAGSAGISGAARISSDKAARLLALVTHERAAGLKISPNFTGEGYHSLSALTEHPDTVGNINPFNWVDKFGPTGSKSNVLAAWQYVHDNPPPRRSRVAIIDGGFWVDSSGKPMSSIGGISDLPDPVVQYDLVDHDQYVDGTNYWSCGGPCEWHGNGAAAVATGIHDNSYGGAGTGGSVADPILLNTGPNMDHVSAAIRIAVAWGADVISMSIGSQCDNVFCDAYFEFNIFPALRHARDNNVVLVAAAGNTPGNSGNIPCRGESVICVGALDDNTNTKISYSAYGPYVDIFAPTNILVMPDGKTNPALKTFTGTSASTPFVAGIIAMMKAYDRSITSDQADSILKANSWKDSPDPLVKNYVNASLSVKDVVENRNGYIKIRTPGEGSSYYIPDNITFNATLYTGTKTLDHLDIMSSIDGIVSGDAVHIPGENRVYIIVGGGTFSASVEHIITMRAIFTDGSSVYDAIPIKIYEAPPVITILSPLDRSEHPLNSTINLNANPVYDPNTLRYYDDSEVGWWIHGVFHASGYNSTMKGTDCPGLGFCGVDFRIIAKPVFADRSVISIIDDPVNLVPTATITSPGNNASFFANKTNVFGGRYYTLTAYGAGEDFEDGILPASSLSWSVISDDGTVTKLGTGSSVTVDLYATGCGSTYTIRLTVSDSSGQTSTHSINVIVTNLC